MNIARYIAAMRAPQSVKTQSVQSEAKIEVWPEMRTIRLEGELGMLVFALRNTEVGPITKSCLEGDKTIVIDASEVSLVPAEVQEWVAFVEEELPDRTLRYKASQLSEVLRYHDGYEHAHSTFEEYGDETPTEFNHLEFAVLSLRELSGNIAARKRGVRNGVTDNDNVVVNLSRPTACAVG